MILDRHWARKTCCHIGNGQPLFDHLIDRLDFEFFGVTRCSGLMAPPNRPQFRLEMSTGSGEVQEPYAVRRSGESCASIHFGRESLRPDFSDRSVGRTIC